MGNANVNFARSLAAILMKDIVPRLPKSKKKSLKRPTNVIYWPVVWFILLFIKDCKFIAVHIHAFNSSFPSVNKTLPRSFNKWYLIHENLSDTYSWLSSWLMDSSQKNLRLQTVKPISLIISHPCDITFPQLWAKVIHGGTLFSSFSCQ